MSFYASKEPKDAQESTELQSIFSLIEDIGKTSSTNEKMELLKKVKPIEKVDFLFFDLDFVCISNCPCFFLSFSLKKTLPRCINNLRGLLVF